MHLLKVDLSHQPLLTEKFKKLDLEISEYSFSNVFLFREIHDYQLFYKNELFLRGVTRIGSVFLMPTNHFMDHMSIEEIRSHLQEVDFFYPIPEEWLGAFDPNIFHYSYNMDDSDYLFTLEKMRTFHGTHSNAKSNLVKQLLERNRVETYTLNLDQIGPALNVLDYWQKNQDLDFSKTDYFSCKEGVNLINKLQLSGVIAYVNHEPAGFIIGERLGKKSFVVHFVKGNKSIKGIYPYLYQILAESLDEGIEFINLEQNMGLTQLRQSKQSYHPDRMIHKWSIRLT